MGKRRGAPHTVGHGWYVTFADLMGLLVAFFVMLVAFSNQDQQKLQIVAGSMRDAFGVQHPRYSGVIEAQGLPTRPQAQERGAHSARGGVADAHAGRGRPPPQFRRQAQRRPRFRACVRVAAPGLAGQSGTGGNLEAHRDRGDQAGAQYRDRRPGRTIDVSGGRKGAVRAHAKADPATGDAAQSHALSGRHYRSHVGKPDAAQSQLRAMGIVRRARQCGAPNSRSGRGSRPATSTWSPARPIRSRCFPMIHILPPIAA